MNSDLLAKLRLLTENIEAQLDWGDSQSWTNKDFAHLSESMFSKTGKQISVTTLKRLWGRAQLIANPSQATLDILAEFADFSDWRSFEKKHRAPPSTSPPKRQNALTLVGSIAIVGVLLFIILGISAFPSQKREAEMATTSIPQDQEAILFEHEKITVGYPNTVIFRYDIGQLPYDSIQIQQSWDTSRRLTVEKPKGLVTSTYYAAGYYSSKLVVNEQIVAQKDLYIPTDGWQALIGGNIPQLIYPKAGQIMQEESVFLDQAVLDEMNEYTGAYLWLTNLLPKPRIHSTQLDLETEFRMRPTEKSICQNIWIVVTGSKDVFRFQFSIPGCVGDLNFFLNMDRISGRNRDLSAFGIAPTDWNNFKVKVRDNQLIASINDEPIFAHQLQDDIGQIGGVQYAFEGLGEIRLLEIKDKKQVLNFLEPVLQSAD